MSDSKALTVVGIGASAGGLSALKAFFKQVPEDTGLAFVVVVHLSPDFESHLADLLQPYVGFTVEQIKETTLLEPNHLYVIPPNANLSAIDTHLRLSQLEERPRDRAQIDHFFRTLANTHDGNGVAVLLTGTGTDGTLGIMEIKASGGLVIVQAPEEAEYDGMPKSAIATGIVDLILPIAEIPRRILEYKEIEPRIALSVDPEEVSPDEGALLQDLLTVLRTRTDRDFSRYKPSTILRRITRRMQLNQVDDLSKYLDLIRRRPEEVTALADDLLITVSSFFRDREFFHKLELEEIPRLFAKKMELDMIRIWSAGCATGEEVYSLAILLSEEAERRQSPVQIQIFASDLHSQALEKARQGIYPANIENEVSTERLKRFFEAQHGGYRIRKEIRDLVVFTPHNLLTDPPFSRLDILSCRNLLIYLEREVQRDLIELFHYALNPDGTLLLGSAESIDGSDLFLVEDKKLCIFRKRNVPSRDPRLPVFPLTRNRLLADTTARGGHTLTTISHGALHQQMVERYAPPSILISPDNKIVHISEHAGRYLIHPGGEPTTNVLMILRQELRIELQVSLQQAREKKEAGASGAISVRFSSEDLRPVVMHVRPAMESERDGFVLVIFEERTPRKANIPQRPSEMLSDFSAARIDELESELSLTRQRLQSIIEEYESNREEMKASSEEIQSSNEELRSTMEELETSKEELQSSNEELQTVNQQFKLKVEELAQLSSDLQNLLSSTDIATLFLGRDLRILRFTPKLRELFNILATDRGRPISDLTHRLGYHELHKDAETVLGSLIPVEREIQDLTGRWYLTRVLPYRAANDQIGGIVITFVDIDVRKRAEGRWKEAKLAAETLIENLHEPLLVLTSNLDVRSANRAFYEHFQAQPQDTIGRKIYDLGNRQWDILALRGLLENLLKKDLHIEDFEVDHHFESIGRRVMLLSARYLDIPQKTILLGIRDITDRVNNEEQRVELLSKDRALAAETALRSTEAELARVVRALSVGELATSIAHEINQPLAGIVTNAEAGMRWLSNRSPSIEEAKESLSLIVRDGNRASTVIRRIREFLQKETPQDNFSVDINEVIDEALALTQSELLKRRIKLRRELSSELGEVRGDRVQLQQVMVNLILNGIDAMADAKDRVLLIRSERTSGALHVSVCDTGSGVDSKNIVRMFDAFYTTKPTGIGMGLAISRTILEACGGRIWAESNDGPGLTIKFEMPSAAGTGETK
ncbi:two-component system, chemotaxis family, CheB/CheR fusion protein [Granulicella rosea]|uniref:histidine kinase n=1 Tax=Granulicella rosea TaxID=474952 RepID=A0A239EF48_9BACT|nr:chemotaxis protein CheB [Granulicella rosea]SNS42512.1 two-component system, chemotaxis family, CheB/CheR fusion protein [Granulicella rosea]